MKAFYSSYTICAQAVRKLENEKNPFYLQLPWGDNIVLIEKLDNFDQINFILTHRS